MPRKPLSTILALALAAGTTAQEPPSASALALVREHLAGAKEVRLEFRVREYCDGLLAKDAAIRRLAGDCLLAVLTEQAAALRQPREGEDRNDYWGRRRQFEQLQRDLAERLENLPLVDDGAEAVPPPLWLWRECEDGETRAHVACAMTAVRTPETDRFFQVVIDGGCTISWALSYALERVAQRDLAVDPAALTRLCQHHQDGVRSRARDLAAARGLTVPEYVAGQTLGGELESLLAFAGELLPRALPADAEWVKLTLPARPEFGQGTADVHGWLLQRGDAKRPWQLLTSFGALSSFEAPTASTAAESLRDYAAHLLAERGRYAATEDFDVHVAIEGAQGIRRFSHGSGEKWRGSAAELLVAAWSAARGDRATACKLLLPLLANQWDDKDAWQPLLHELAAALDEAMLEAFTNARYEEAVELAKKLASPRLATFPHQERARELSAQLKHRGDDFRNLQLPTAERWQELRKELPRDRQIDYLVQRLRLLRCQQWSNPGWLSYEQDQVEVSRPESQPAVVGEHARINPFAELLHFNLKIGELPALLPALESRDYVLAFDLERFLPQRPQSLHRVAWVAATICNEVAQQALVDPRHFLGTEAERNQARADFVAFCTAHADQTAADRLAARMLEVEDWQDVRQAFWSLHAIDPVRAAARMREVGNQQPATMPAIVRLFALLDRGEFAGDARAWLHADDADQRFFAAVLSLRHRQEAAAALAVIEARLRDDGGALLVPGAVEALLAAELPAARTLLLALLAGAHASHYQPTPAFVQRLVRAGIPEARMALDDALAGKRALAVPWNDGAASPEQALQCLVLSASEWWPGPSSPAVDDAKAAAAAGEAFRAKLAADWQRITTGQAPAMKAAELELPWGDLQTFSTGWIRRM